MTKRARFIIFIIFIVFFVLITPAVVLTTAGYKYSWRQNALVHTSLLVLDSLPDGAGISLDGAETRFHTPARIPGLIPGEHVVKISRVGYSPWEKRLTLAPGETTFAEHVRLFKQSDPAPRLGENVNDFFAVDSSALLLARYSPTSTLLVWDEGRNDSRVAWQGTTSGTFALSPISATRVALIVEEKSKRVWIQNIDREPKNTLLVPTETFKKIQSLVAAPNGRFAWATIRGGTVLRFNLDTKKIEALGRAAGSVLLGDGDRFFAIRPGLGAASLIRLTDPTRTTGEEIVPLPHDRFTLIPGGAPYVALQSNRGDLIVIDPNQKQGERVVWQGTATKAKWQSAKGELHLVGSDGHDLWIFDPLRRTSTLITRASATISDFALHPDAAHLLYVQGGVLQAIELDERDRRNTASWEGIKNIRVFTLTERAKSALVFGETDTGGLKIYELGLE